jgi:hypothetical protein
MINNTKKNRILSLINEMVIKEVKKQTLLKEQDEMTPQEVKEELLDEINKMKKTTNQWSTRDTLKKFTEYGFWQGGVMASLDSDTAKEVAEQLYDYVKGLKPGHWGIEEIYDSLY